jgi:hypothetical protein
MEREKLVTLVEQLLVEVTVQRLVLRSVVVNLIAKSDTPMAGLIDTVAEEAAMTSPDVFPLPDVSADLQRRASAIAIERAQLLLQTFGQGLRRRTAA